MFELSTPTCRWPETNGLFTNREILRPSDPPIMIVIIVLCDVISLLALLIKLPKALLLKGVTSVNTSLPLRFLLSYKEQALPLSPTEHLNGKANVERAARRRHVDGANYRWI